MELTLEQARTMEILKVHNLEDGAWADLQFAQEISELLDTILTRLYQQYPVTVSPQAPPNSSIPYSRQMEIFAKFQLRLQLQVICSLFM